MLPFSTPLLQIPNLLRSRPQQAAPDTLQGGAPDTLTAADTLSLSERLRADSTLVQLSPESFRAFLNDLQADLLDTALWMGVVGALIRIILIILLAYIFIKISEKVTRRWTKRVEELPAIHPRRQRAFTISHLVHSTARYVAWPIAIIMVLSELNVDVGALIATAGIAGLAIGFGAQTLVKDVISGIFLLFDDSIHAGDLVRVGTDMGTVEDIGVRLIKVRKFDGELLMVPAGELRIFGNKSIGFVRVIVNVGLAYEQDIETVLPVMQRVAEAWAAEHKHILMEATPQIQAITDFAASSINARIVMMVTPGEQFEAERQLRVRLKREFDRLGIEIPFARQTVYLREEKEQPPRTIIDPDLSATHDTDTT